MYTEKGRMPNFLVWNFDSPVLTESQFSGPGHVAKMQAKKGSTSYINKDETTCSS
eukprot:jgi/Botrbrau1/15960/Bobra.0340s0008.1